MRVESVLDGGGGAEKGLAEIGQDGGATSGDAVLHEENGEMRKKNMNIQGGAESGELAGESRR